MGSISVDLENESISSDTFTFAKDDATTQNTTLSTTTVTTTVTTPVTTVTTTTTTTTVTTTQKQTDAPKVADNEPVTNSYVLNTSTHKFHKPSCGDVEKISSENYATFSGSRDELIAQDYDPCKHCKP
jgi:DNA-entry nuclease